MNFRYQATPSILNYGLFIIGMVIVGFVTNWNLAALLGAWVASIHVTVTIKE